MNRLLIAVLFMCLVSLTIGAVMLAILARNPI